jgi:glycosyltransferase involved in cell wall biosynthesis
VNSTGSDLTSTAAHLQREPLASAPSASRANSSGSHVDAASYAGIRRARILMFGPDLAVRGGVSAVQRLLLKCVADVADVHQIGTMTEGSNWRKMTTFARAFARALIEMRKSRYDVVHIHFSSGASSVRKMILAALAQSRGLKVILHAHGGAYGKYWRQAPAFIRNFTGRVLRSADCLIVLGEKWREFYSSVGVPPSKIVVLPNPVEWPASVPNKPAGDKTVFVYLGLIARLKGAYDIVEALAKVDPVLRAQTYIVMAGNGALAELQDRVDRARVQNNVEVLSWVDTIERDALLARADAFLLPSYAEGLPMSLLEAMANGLAPICTPVGSIPEFVRDGVNGLLVPPGDTDKLAAAMERMVRDRDARVRMARIARATVEPLSLARYAQRLTSIYRSLGGGTASRAL